MIRALIINNEIRARIAEIVQCAQANADNFEVLNALAKAVREGRYTSELRARYDDRTMDIPQGFTVTFTHEEQRPGVICRHISISVDVPNLTANVEQAAAIVRAFGFINHPLQAPHWVEDIHDGFLAINVVEPLNGDIHVLRTPVDGTVMASVYVDIDHQ